MISWETSYLKHCSIKFKSLVEIESGDYKERKKWRQGESSNSKGRNQFTKLTVILEAM